MQSDLDFVPNGYKTINFTLAVRNAPKALDFYNRAFGAELVMKLTDPNGVIVHAEMKIIDTILMITEDANENPATSSVVLQIYVEDVEGFVEEAMKAGAHLERPIQRQFYGDRTARLKDPFGHIWVIATHEETLTPAELQQRFNAQYN